jgi:hypothetical protein
MQFHDLAGLKHDIFSQINVIGHNLLDGASGCIENNRLVKFVGRKMRLEIVINMVANKDFPQITLLVGNNGIILQRNKMTDDVPCIARWTLRPANLDVITGNN